MTSSAAVTHPICSVVLGALSDSDDGLVLSDSGVVAVEQSLRTALNDADDLVFACEGLLTLAYFLDTEKKAPLAATTLLTFVVAAQPLLDQVGSARARLASDNAGHSARRMRAFQGDHRVAQVLDSGARPEGTTPAGPFARFAVDRAKK